MCYVNKTAVILRSRTVTALSYKTSGRLHLSSCSSLHQAFTNICTVSLNFVCVREREREVKESILFFHLPCSVTFVPSAEHVQDNFSILPAVDSCGVNYTKAAALGGLGWCSACVSVSVCVSVSLGIC